MRGKRYTLKHAPRLRTIEALLTILRSDRHSQVHEAIVALQAGIMIFFSEKAALFTRINRHEARGLRRTPRRIPARLLFLERIPSADWVDTAELPIVTRQVPRSERFYNFQTTQMENRTVMVTVEDRAVLDEGTDKKEKHGV